MYTYRKIQIQKDLQCIQGTFCQCSPKIKCTTYIKKMSWPKHNNSTMFVIMIMVVIPDFPDPIAPKITMLHSGGSCSGTVTMLQVLAFPNIRDILKTGWDRGMNTRGSRPESNSPLDTVHVCFDLHTWMMLMLDFSPALSAKQLDRVILQYIRHVHNHRRLRCTFVRDC